MRGSLAAVKAEQSSLYWTMSILWAFQNWESCPRSRSVFRSERCLVRVTLGERGSSSLGMPPGHGAGCGMLMPCSPHIHPEHPSAIRTQVLSCFPASPVAEGERSVVNSRWCLLLWLLVLPPPCPPPAALPWVTPGMEVPTKRGRRQQHRKALCACTGAAQPCP